MHARALTQGLSVIVCYRLSSRYSESLPAIHVNAGIIHLQNKIGSGDHLGRRTMTLSASRQQFLACESREADIQYKRRGGMFVTKCVCAAFVMTALVFAALVGVAVFFALRYQINQQSNDIWTDSDPMAQITTNSKNLRLSKSVVPSFYRLKLKPDLDKSTFSGEVFITLKSNAHNVRSIVLHSKDLSIHDNYVLTEQVYQKIQTIQVRSKRQVVPDAASPSNETVPQVTETSTASPVSSQPVNETSVDANNTNANGNITKVEEEKLDLTEKGFNSTDATNSTHLPVTGVETSTSLVPITKADERKNSAGRTSGSDAKESTQVTNSNTRNIKIKSMDKDKDRLIFNLESPLKPGTDYTLELSFYGNITDSLNGFYKSSYIDKDKKAKLLAVTQFEPVSARAAFPCFDEPSFKAMFEISIAHPENMTALSNMAVAAKEPIPEKPGWTWTHFDRSVKMSTYLVAYTVCDFKFLETSYLSTDNTTKPIKVWARAGLVDNAQYALKIIPKLLVFYEELFGVPYALNKLDLIAVPDFSSGAMENWGLITFRETTLLYDEKTHVARDKQSVAVDVSHELAHQWFGNLVTMSWWTDLWLNEGFATYVEYLGVNHVEPEWNMLDTFTKDKMELLRSDALKHTTPVSKVVSDASEIAQKFDEISYAKGASLIRMLNHTITEKLFHKGLVAYLKKWMFANAAEEDLWAAMSQAAPLAEVSLVKFMKSWSGQPGYPVLTVSRNYSTGDLLLRQDLFTVVKNPFPSRLSQLWYIPVSYTTIDTALGPWDTAPKIWLSERQKHVNITLDKSQAIYVNVESIGYYRVNYDTYNWHLLNRALNTNSKVVPPLARAQLLDDAFNLAKVARLDYRTALELTTYLEKGDDSRVVWEIVLSNWGFLRLTLRNTPYYSDFQDYVLRILRTELEKRQFGVKPPRDDDEAFLMENLLTWECVAESPRCLSWARDLFQRWMNSTDLEDNPVPSYLRSLVYSTALRYGGRAEFDFLWRVYRGTSEPGVQNCVVGALSNTRDEGLIRLLLERSLTELPGQLAPLAWSYDSVAGAAVTQQFFTEQWPRVRDKFARMDTFVLASIISGVFGGVSSQSELDHFKRFVEQHAEELRPHMQSILKLVDSASLRIDWIATHSRHIGLWLQRYRGSGGAANDTTISSDEKSSNTTSGNVVDAPNTPADVSVASTTAATEKVSSDNGTAKMDAATNATGRDPPADSATALNGTSAK